MPYFSKIPMEYPIKRLNHGVHRRKTEGKSRSFHHTVEMEQPYAQSLLLGVSIAAEGLPKLLQKIMPRDTFRAVTHDVVRCHLAVDQLAMPRFQPLHQPDQRQLGCVGAHVEHGFPEKRPPQPDPVQAAHKRISGRVMLPHFNGMGKTQFMQAGVGIHHSGMIHVPS